MLKSDNKSSILTNAVNHFIWACSFQPPINYTTDFEKHDLSQRWERERYRKWNDKLYMWHEEKIQVCHMKRVYWYFERIVRYDQDMYYITLKISKKCHFLNIKIYRTFINTFEVVTSYNFNRTENVGFNKMHNRNFVSTLSHLYNVDIFVISTFTNSLIKR